MKKERIEKLQNKINKLLEGDINDLRMLDKVDSLERQITEIEAEEETQDDVVQEQPVVVVLKEPTNHELVYNNLIAIPSPRKIYRSQDAYNLANSRLVDSDKEKSTYSSLKPKKR